MRDKRVDEVVLVSVPALARGSIGQITGDLIPMVLPELFDEGTKLKILLGCELVTGRTTTPGVLYFV
jgi:hypothetical protein